MWRPLGMRMALPALGLLFGLGWTAEGGAPDAGAPTPLRVVLDPGHGGTDYGARGASGLLEKDVVLALGRRLGEELEARGIEVVYTRERDRFVTLPERTEIANRAGADLFLSLHANASPDAEARGFEIYFLSLDASDEEAKRVATVENRVFRQKDAVPDSGDVVGSILGDLIRTEHLRASSALAASIQRQIERLPGSSRGVKQAPFVVLMGVNMPAALLEIGFLTHRGEERSLRTARRQREIARAVARALERVRRSGPGGPLAFAAPEESSE